MKKNSVREIVTYKMVFNDQPLPTMEYLQGIGKAKLFSIAQFYLGFKIQNSEFDNFNVFFEKLFSPDNGEFAGAICNRLNTLEQHKVNSLRIINVFSSLKLFELAYNHVSENTTQSNSEIEKNIFKAYLTLNQEWFEDRSQVAFDSTENLEIHLKPQALMFSSIFPHWDLEFYDKKKYFLSQFCKAVLLYEFLEEQYPYLLNSFISQTNTTNWREFIKKIIPLGAALLNERLEGITYYTISKDAEFDSNCDFIEKLTLDDENLMEKDDFRQVRNRPLLMIEKGNYAVIHEQFVYDKIYKGLYFQFEKVNRSLSTSQKTKDLRGEITKEFSEKILLYKIIKRSFKNRYKQYSGDQLEKENIKGAPDYYIRNGKKILLIENKDILINVSIKTSFDYGLYFAAIEEKLLTVGVGQLLNNIKLILSNKKKFDLDFNGERAEIFPIIVLHDNMYNTPGFNSILNFHFLKEIASRKFAGLDTSCVHSITIIDIDTLISISDSLENKRCDIFQLLSAYTRKQETSRQKFDSREDDINNHKEKILNTFSQFIRKLNIPISCKLFINYGRRLFYNQ